MSTFSLLCNAIIHHFAIFGFFLKYCSDLRPTGKKFLYIMRNSFVTYWALWVSRVLKHPKKCLEDLTTFFMSTWWRGSKNMKEIEFSRWLSGLPANSAHLAANFCPALVCPQKATVRLQFLPYFWNPLIK